MSDSDSDLSSTIPSNTELDQGLRATFKRLRRESPDAEFTVNSVRRAAEKRLGLDDGFFGVGEWKAKSKLIITEEFDRADDGESAASPAKSVPIKKKKSSAEPGSKKPAPIATAKRKTDRIPVAEDTRGKKKRKTSEESDSPDPESSGAESVPATKTRRRRASTSDFSEVETVPRNETKKPRPHAESEEDSFSDTGSEQPVKPPKKGANTVREGSSALSDVDSESSAGAKAKPSAKEDAASDSEMSVLVDDDSPPKTRKKSVAGEGKSASKAKQGRPKSKKETAVADPDQEEIKKLQGQLGQCGIRKVWGKYLKPYETSRAKIRHLKEMLSEAGISGRFSSDKARQIREQRELAADLEAVQEGEKVWGRRRGQKADDPEPDKKPQRTVAKGLAALNEFISDGEESSS